MSLALIRCWLIAKGAGAMDLCLGVSLAKPDCNFILYVVYLYFSYYFRAGRLDLAIDLVEQYGCDANAVYEETKLVDRYVTSIMDD